MEVKFKTTERDGKKALWVNDYNIWDLMPGEFTPDVQKAIKHAYHLGIEQYKRYLQDIMYEGPFETIGDPFE